MKMNEDFSRLEELISRWAVETGIHTKSGSTDKNKYSEYIAAELLNAAFSYKLKVLSKNHPAVDLGDPTHGIAFSITSRTDAKKIRSDLHTFKDNDLISEYPQGIRFLLLVDKKVDWRKKIKNSFTEIMEGFDADQHIYTLAGVVERLKSGYVENPGAFQDILAILEWQFGNKAGEPPLPFIRQMLIQGSRSYHQALTGKTGRFRRLHIEDLLLTRPKTESEWVPQPVSMEEENNSSQTDDTVITLLPRLWNRPVEHAVIVGEGGMGKTVSLVRLWETYLERAATDTEEPIPVFIALHEFNHRTDSTGSAGDFIRSRIAETYFDDERFKNGLNKLFKNRAQTEEGLKVPAVVLLLDGFNEITVEKRELLLELNKLVEQCPGLQVVITSRYDMRGNFNWGHWNLVKLKELDEDKVEEYLQGQGMAVPKQERLRGLIRNPMMLTLYAASCEVQANHRESRYCCFKETVESPGELLWNFIEAQVAKLPERLGQDEEKTFYYKFLLKFLLPALGFEMEKAGLFAFTGDQINVHLDNICIRFSQDDFFDTFHEFEKYIDILPIGEYSESKERRKRTSKLREILCNELCMMVEEGNSFRFLHQNFRDFFAAVHVLNEDDIRLNKGEIPGVLKDRILDYFVRRLVGEIEGEHRCKPYLVKGEGWKIDINKENRLYKALELCRGKFSNDEPPNSLTSQLPNFLTSSLAVWNIVTIWKEVRGELTGADLSNLDLSGVALNGVRCSRFYSDRYLAASFASSRVHEKNLLPQGHSDRVTSAVYSADGKKIFSSSWDQTIKEWDAGTGELVKTLAGHTHRVTSVVYSPDGEKILSASWDGTIKEWDAETGEGMKTLVGHKGEVTSAVYSPDGKKILSASLDCTIKEWDAGTGEGLKTLVGHRSVVTSAVYRPDGEKILSASMDQTIKEWDAGAGECVKTLAGHTSDVNSAVYSPDGKKILSASWDNTIKEWDAGTGECLKNLAGHTDGVLSAVYSRDGEKILSTSTDGTIKEWDAGTGECLKNLAGHTSDVNSAVYSPDGKKILSTSSDETIKEWDSKAGECVKTLAGHSDGVNSAVYSPDGKNILSASSDETIKEWDAGTGECVKTLAGHINAVKSAEYSPDGGKIISASWDKTIKEWDAGTGEVVKTLAGHTGEVWSAVYRPDGKKIISASWDKTIKEWDAATGELVKTLSGHTGSVWSAVYSPDGKKILSASADQTIKEWDAETGECMKTLAGHSNGVRSAVYSPDGKIIFYTSDDSTIKEWDAANGICLKTHNQKDNPVIPGFPPNDINIKLKIKGNKIYIPDASGQGESELMNVPGLFIQGCSFKNLEKGSQWSEEGLAILRQYCAMI